MQQEPGHRLSSWEWFSHPKILRPATVCWESWLCRIPGLWSHPEPRSLLNPCSRFGCTNHDGDQSLQTRGTMGCVYLWFYAFPLRPLRFQSHSRNFKEKSQHFRRKWAVVEFGAELFEFTPGGTFGSLRAHTLRKCWHKINKSGLDREPLKQRHSFSSQQNGLSMAAHGRGLSENACRGLCVIKSHLNRWLLSPPSWDYAKTTSVIRNHGRSQEPLPCTEFFLFSGPACSGLCFLPLVEQGNK